MEDPIEINRLNWDERAVIHGRDAAGDYLLGPLPRRRGRAP